MFAKSVHDRILQPGHNLLQSAIMHPKRLGPGYGASIEICRRGAKTVVDDTHTPLRTPMRSMPQSFLTETATAEATGRAAVSPNDKIRRQPAAWRSCRRDAEFACARRELTRFKACIELRSVPIPFECMLGETSSSAGICTHRSRSRNE